MKEYDDRWNNLNISLYKYCITLDRYICVKGKLTGCKNLKNCIERSQ